MSTAVTAVTSYGAGASSSRVRVYGWLDHLGIPYSTLDYLGRSDNRPRDLIRLLPHVAAAELRLRRAAATLTGTVLLSREASPLSNGAVESKILGGADRGIYDFDDALFAYPMSGLGRWWSKRKVWASAVAAADLVIAGNEYLADAASGISDSVVMIPSCVEPSEYIAKARYEVEGPPSGVWVGSPSTERYLRRISAPLMRWHRGTGLRLIVVSAGRASLGELDEMVTRVTWTPAAAATALAEADFGIMPLSDDPYTRGKCAYKLLQYGATGLPVVASPVGANRLALERMGGFAARTDDEWADAIAAIVDASSAQRAAWGAQGADAVSRYYSFEAWRSTFEQALRGTDRA